MLARWPGATPFSGRIGGLSTAPAMKLLLVVAAAAAFSSSSFPDGPRPTGAPAVPVAAWQVDGVHSSVVFKVKHANTSWFYGTFGKVAGTANLGGDAAEAKVEIVIDAASIHSGDEKRDQHLRNADFFDAKQFPDVRFASKKVVAKGDGFEIEGELELRGQTQPLSVAVAKVGEGEMMGQKRVGYEAKFTIQRSKFGMNYGVAKNMLGDDVEVTVSLALVPQK